jgi:predicted component of type VI protein secretion system
VEVPSLLSSQGFVFELGAPPILIGRRSRGAEPDVDLTEIDPEMASSRRHARILLRDQTYALEALPTTNGTFVNGRELKAGEVQPLQSGDRLLFGSDGVELSFFLGGETIPPSFFRPD